MITNILFSEVHVWSRTCQVPVIKLKNVLEQVGGEELEASHTVVLDTGDKERAT